ncbi:hypothetical protein [Thiomicrorhabdus sp. Kp2]|uniref:hypothetical protein n=1 Tax=Thiomicrorhabdus sp. Kp2 TaxID=1123518 RepID=UPI00042011D5|nr:hypothetical protein [Thiomicrorhabdus sp. Kp2]
MIEHYLCEVTNKIATTSLTPEFLSDLGVITLVPMVKPNIQLLEQYEQSGDTCVEVSGLFFRLDSIE